MLYTSIPAVRIINKNRPPSWKINHFLSKPSQLLLLECHIPYKQRQTNDSLTILAGKLGAVILLVNVTCYLSLEHRLETSPGQPSLLLLRVIRTVQLFRPPLEPSCAKWNKAAWKPDSFIDLPCSLTITVTGKRCSVLNWGSKIANSAAGQPDNNQFVEGWWIF